MVDFLCAVMYIMGVILCFLFLPASSAANADDGEDGFIAAVLGFTGASAVEELDEYEMERLYEYYRHPLRLNSATRSRLLSSGLFSAYQVAVLMDIRELTGDIFSFEELSALDGFGYGFVSGIAPFVSLASDAVPGASSFPDPVLRNTVTIKSGMRNVSGNFDPEGTYSMKYRVEAGESLEAGLSARSSYAEEHFPPGKYSFFVAYYGRKFPGKIVAGDFSLRFGQGLALWPGFSMSGVSSADSFIRRPSGIAPYNSYSGEGAFRGLAADAGFGHFSVSSFVSGLGLRDMMEGKDTFSRDFLYGLNAGWSGMHGQVSMTCYAVSGTADTELLPEAKLSADARFSIRGTDVFSEVAYDFVGNAAAALAGVRAGISDALQMAAMVRYYPSGYSSGYAGAVRGGTKCSNEYGASAALSHSAGNWVDIAGKTGFGSSEKRFRGDLSIDMIYSPEPKYGVDTSSHQIKLLLVENIRISRYFSASVRYSGRYRSYGLPFRTDVRTDFKFSSAGWNANLRFNILHCRNFSYLSYLECGYKAGNLSAWLRTGAFIVDSWDDRIYAYERDAPGNFNVPAYYGRGYWLSFNSGIRLYDGIRLYLRASYQDYPWQLPESADKPPKAEVKIQLVMDLRKRMPGKKHDVF